MGNMTDYLGDGAPSKREGIRGGSRKDGPLLEGPVDPVREARELLGWMKANGLLTEDRTGAVRLRTKGREVLAALNTIDQIERNRP